MTSPDILSTTRAAVKEYTEKGLSPREIATLLGISRQRVYVHLQKLNSMANHPTTKAVNE